jgi:hypothetical protein
MTGRGTATRAHQWRHRRQGREIPVRTAVIAAVALAALGAGITALVNYVTAPAAPVAVAVADQPGARVKYYVVPPGNRETLEEVAAKTLGDPSRSGQIIAFTRSRLQPDGGRLVDETIKPGWVLWLPIDAQGPGVQLGRVPNRPPAAKPDPDETSLGMERWVTAGVALFVGVPAAGGYLYYKRYGSPFARRREEERAEGTEAQDDKAWTEPEAGGWDATAPLTQPGRRRGRSDVARSRSSADLREPARPQSRARSGRHRADDQQTRPIPALQPRRGPESRGAQQLRRAQERQVSDAREPRGTERFRRVTGWSATESGRRQAPAEEPRPTRASRRKVRQSEPGAAVGRVRFGGRSRQA